MMGNCNESCDLDSMLVHKATPEYLQDLLKDKKQLQNFPNIFLHLEIILEKEITRVREKLFHLNESFRKTENELPEPSGSVITLQEKVFVPIKENPNYNFVGRLLGPRGLTAKQLEQDLECKIMVRGRGSLRDKKKEDMNRGKPNWEHLDEDLHVLVSVEDYENRAAIKLRRATETIRQFLEQGVRTPENEDRLKQLQLMELAVLNDKDRQQAHAHHSQQQQFLLHQQSMTVLNNQAAVAAAAAAQLLHPTGASHPTNQLLARLQTQTSLFGNTNIHLNPAVVSLPGSAAAAAIQSTNGSLPLGGGCNLTSYLSGSMLNSVLGSTGGSSSTTTAANTQSAPLGVGLPLSQLPVASGGIGLTTLSLPMTPGLQTPVHSNLISASSNSMSDQLAAMAAALFSGNSGATANTGISLSGVKAPLPGSTPSKGSTTFYTMTSLPNPLLDSVNIIEYASSASGLGQEANSESLKMRGLTGSSGHHRMHPYLR